MRQYALRRVLLVIPTLLVVSVFIFAIIRLIPGDIVDAMVVEGGYAANAEELRHRLGLDRPIHVQYLDWLLNMLRGDWGVSLHTGESATSAMAKKVPVTLELGGLSLLITVLVALPLGVLSAVRQDTAVDYMARSLAYLMHSVPYFWIATMVLVFPSIWWEWTPPLKYTPLLQDPLDNLLQFVIPAAILGIYGASGLVRLTRAMMLEVLSQDYIRTAWAKGLLERAILYRHALKNAMIPVITLIGLRAPVIIGGAVIMENIFVLPGMGRWLVESVNYRDYPMLQIGVLLFTLVVVVSNLAVDLSYAWLDPRVRYR